MKYFGKKAFVVRDGNDFWTISAVCTHLECTVNYVLLTKIKEVKAWGEVLNERWEFSCPCHGSKYYADGTNYAGPAPRPLPRFYVDISPVIRELIGANRERGGIKAFCPCRMELIIE